MKRKEAFIQIPLLIMVIVFSVVVGGMGYGAVEYHKVSKAMGEAEQLTREGKYDEAIAKLEPAQNKLFGKMILKQKISTELDTNKKLLEDKSEYNQGIEEFNKENWEKAKELLLKVSEISPHYQDAKSKIEEAQKKITEKQIAKAVEKSTKEAKKKAEEAKRAAEEAQRKIKGEEAKRIAAEVQRKAEEEKTKEKTAELEQKIVELQQKQQFQLQESYKASEIVESLGKYIVNIVCFGRYGDATIGSGIIYALGSEGQDIILTNYHITEDADLTLEYPCVVAYSSDPTKGLTDFYFAEPVYYPSVVSLSTMQLIDFDFLSIQAKFRLPEYGGFEIIPNASLKITDRAPVVCSEDKIKVGEEIVILGYPTIGGEYLTATEGIISGYEGTYYLTTSAKIEQGSSGGGAFLKSTGCLAGMPTFVRLGRIEAFARLINMPYLQQNYLLKIWGTTTGDASDSIFCNGQFWDSCPAGQGFYCPPMGDPQCYSPDSIFCNNKYWSPCPFGQKFYCPPVGDPYCY